MVTPSCSQWRRASLWLQLPPQLWAVHDGQLLSSTGSMSELRWEELGINKSNAGPTKILDPAVHAGSVYAVGCGADVLASTAQLPPNGAAIDTHTTLL